MLEMCFNSLVLVLVLTVVSASNSSTILNLLKDVLQSGKVNTLLYLKNQHVEVPTAFLSSAKEQHSFERLLMEELDLPLIQLDARQSFYLKNYFGEHIFALVYLEADWNQNIIILEKLLENTNHIRFIGFLFMLNHERENEVFLQKLFQYCWQSNMLNVAAVFTSFQSTSWIYRYNRFPIFKIEKIQYERETIIYPEHIKNLKGYELSIVAGGLEPRMLVKNSKAEENLILGGVVGNFMMILQEKLNVTFVTPFAYEGPTPSENHVAVVKNGTVELSTGITFPFNSFEFYRIYTYPFELIDWCIMMPVPVDIQRSYFFFKVFSWQAFSLALIAVVIMSMLMSLTLFMRGELSFKILDPILNFTCLRGMLGLSFTEVSKPTRLLCYIYLLISVFGIQLTTFYNAYFASYFTSAPKYRELGTLKDIQNANFKIYAWRKEIDTLIVNGYLLKYKKIFVRETNINKFLALRNSLDTRYGYMLPTSNWNIILTQQMHFTKPLFYLPKNLCVLSNIPMSFPIKENSFFLQYINQFILNLNQYGFIDHWHEFAFYELKVLGKINVTNPISNDILRPISIHDVQFIFIGMLIMSAFSILVFFVELYIYQRKQRKVTNNLGKGISK